MAMRQPIQMGGLIAALVAIAGFVGYHLGGDTTDRSDAGQAEAPLIGIASLTSDNYANAVRKVGGIPVVLPNAEGAAAQVDDYLELLDGLILPGGADIPPSEYGEEPHETVKLLDDDRFQFEKAISRAWIERTDKPLLGICLGSQWVNVSSGGSLVQDIPSQYGISHRDRDHEVTIEPDSKLAGIFRETRFTVNSLHHQAVGRVGENLRVVARCPDGVVEATETTDPDRFLIGVQWHPEKLMPDDRRQTKLLEAFVAAAAKAKARRGRPLETAR